MKNKKVLEQLIDNKNKAIPAVADKDGFKLIGTFKLKDKESRHTIAFKIMPDMEGVVVHKVKGENNKVIVAVKMVEKTEYGKMDKDGNVTKIEVEKNEKKSKAQ